MPPYTSSKSAVLAALIEGQRNRLRNEAAWRQEDPLSGASPEPADPPPAVTPPRPEPQLNLPHLGDIWDRMQKEKRSLGINRQDCLSPGILTNLPPITSVPDINS
jgi:hypothetical protein